MRYLEWSDLKTKSDGGFRGWGTGKWGVGIQWGQSFSWGKMKRVLEIDGGVGHTIVYTGLARPNGAPENGDDAHFLLDASYHSVFKVFMGKHVKC